ncbi:MAG: hypothetical protein UT63_C0039G0002 [Candidatus Gottesmanbacteria bacterium GW2011_GWC2_39_8]|uniref:DUF1611 domain-containing protein n=1 Tax=Candidatus Gottesmanbacteria bacterium GW2011_GWC2_39_8 TaxID=1618450 RepID=A0A0G0PXB8_9BACT|nr:MAG: hypothetical protein UT63_C0039G0002 [Candidatus Gottesmanbacteria bacterium GW2011_GWC2_39_8]
MKNKKITLDKIGSVLKNIELPNELVISGSINSKEGQAIVVLVLTEEEKYGQLELVSGRMSKIRTGDFIAGVLGERKALEGIVGKIPKNVKPGKILNILNLGGVIGEALSWNKDVVSQPIKVKVLGSIVSEGKCLNIHNFSLKPETHLHITIPVISVMGTAMGVGKTTVASTLIHILAKKMGLKVAAVKLTGVATQKDILAMQDSGAVKTLTFHDVGLTSTLNNHDAVVPAAKSILNSLGNENPDLIVAELGDGIIGWYGVDKLLKDKEFIKSLSFTILCAHDLVGAVGGADMLKKLGAKVDFFAGPVTNNSAGTDYLEKILRIPGEDLREDSSKLVKALTKKGVLSS